jgi:hypothetical protein
MSITEKLIARVNQLPARQRREVLDFIEFLHRQRNRQKQADQQPNLKDDQEHIALGKVGAILAAKVLEKEDFSDWPGYEKVSRRKRRK